MRTTSLGPVLLAALATALYLTDAGIAQTPTPQQVRGPRGDEEGGGGRRTQRVVPLEEVEVASPDGRVKFKLLSNPERLSYTVTMGDVTVIEPSPLAIDVDDADLTSSVSFDKIERYQIDETYPWHGVHNTAVNQCNGATITYAHDLSLTKHTLEVRAFNNGIAFRHIIPGEDSAARVPDERTLFIVPAGSKVWYHNLDGHYEAPYVEQDIADVKAGHWAGPPVTFQLPDGKGYGAITEANLVNYSGMALESDGRRGWIVGLGHRHPINYPFELRYGREEAKRLSKAAAVNGTITTPWRVVLATPDLNALVNSDIVPSLCPPPDKQYFPEGIKTAWVEPGTAVWLYVDGGDRSFEGLKEFSRMAGELGAKYHIIEGLWSRWTPEQIREIVEYSKERGVRLVFWKHSNRLRTPEAREEFFKLLHDYGVAGAKIDFIDHEAKESVDLYEDLLKKAAEYQIVIDFHGANKPTGRMRTWPNDMIREAVRGMESGRMRDRARHQTTIPFTRYLAGPADYTTMIFNERRADTTWTNQIASLATLDSPMLTIAAHPQNVLDNPAVDVIKSIPPVWDETIVLPDSKIGQLSAFARRKDAMWMLAVMCGPQPQKIEVPLAFLGDGTYKASIVRDDKEKDDAVALENRTVQRGNSLTIDLRQGGGFVARFTKN